MSLITFGRFHQAKDTNGLVMTLEEHNRFLCVWLLLCEQFCRFANGGAKISIKIFFFSQCIQQQ